MLTVHAELVTAAVSLARTSEVPRPAEQRSRAAPRLCSRLAAGGGQRAVRSVHATQRSAAHMCSFAGGLLGGALLTGWHAGTQGGCPEAVTHPIHRRISYGFRGQVLGVKSWTQLLTGWHAGAQGGCPEAVTHPIHRRISYGMDSDLQHRLCVCARAYPLQAASTGPCTCSLQGRARPAAACIWEPPVRPLRSHAHAQPTNPTA